MKEFNLLEKLFPDKFAHEDNPPYKYTLSDYYQKEQERLLEQRIQSIKANNAWKYMMDNYEPDEDNYTYKLGGTF